MSKFYTIIKKEKNKYNFVEKVNDKEYNHLNFFIHDYFFGARRQFEITVEILFGITYQKTEYLMERMKLSSQLKFPH